MKKGIKLFWAFTIPFIMFNPIVISIIVNQIQLEITDLERFFMGIYGVVWAIIGGWVFLPMIYKKPEKPQKIRNIDDIIDDSWKDYYKEKQQEQKQ